MDKDDADRIAFFEDEVDFLRRQLAQRDEQIKDLQAEDSHCLCRADIYQLEQQIDAISSALAATQWRSMDSAPKDGTYILLWMGDFALIGRWFDATHRGWWVSQCLPVHPTHWMPLPEPPKDDNPNKEDRDIMKAISSALAATGPCVWTGDDFIHPGCEPTTTWGWEFDFPFCPHCGREIQLSGEAGQLPLCAETGKETTCNCAGQQLTHENAHKTHGSASEMHACDNPNKEDRA